MNKILHMRLAGMLTLTGCAAGAPQKSAEDYRQVGAGEAIEIMASESVIQI